MIGHDLERRRRQELPRLAHPLRHPLRDPARARLPASRPTSTSRSSAAAPSGSSARSSARRGSRWRPTPPGGSSAPTAATRNRVEGDVFVTEYASLPLLARWILRQDGRAIPLEPSALRRLVDRGRPRRAARARGRAARARPPRCAPAWRERPSSASPGPVAPERFGVLQSLLAYLLAACGEEREAVIPAHELVERFSIPRRAARGAPLAARTSSTSAAAATRSTPSCTATRCTSTRSSSATPSAAPPRLTPLEARAIRLALEFVGPMIAAGAHSPLDRVRAKLEETFGEFELTQTPDAARRRRGGPRRDAHAGDRRPQARRDRVPEAGVGRGRDAHGRAVRDRAAPAALVRPHLGRRPRRAAQLPARPHAQGEGSCAAASRRARASTRRSCSRRRRARIWYSPEVARWEVEKGAPPARRRRRAVRAAGRQRRVARRRGALVPRRGGRARAGRAAGARRAARARARAPSWRQPLDLARRQRRA